MPCGGLVPAYELASWQAMACGESDTSDPLVLNLKSAVLDTNFKRVITRSDFVQISSNQIRFTYTYNVESL